MKEISPGVVVDPKIKFGKPVIKGTRVPIELVLDELANGMTMDEVKKEYRLTEQQILNALQYARAMVANEEIIIV